ncbi:MAG TPA: hypothetical protein DGF10_05720 [Acidimicrobiaceae bacterium]|nr:hypothetical protein [Acidimicrobiaceae bacterium]HCV34147.1 hypothetical protein [Acidimicrobiaceae bacterium]
MRVAAAALWVDMAVDGIGLLTGRPAGFDREVSPYTGPMAVLRLFASVRVAAGTGKLNIPGNTVGDVLTAASQKFGDEYAGVAANCRVWLNGESADPADAVTDDDEVALLPPVSGG